MMTSSTSLQNLTEEFKVYNNSNSKFYSYLLSYFKNNIIFSNPKIFFKRSFFSLKMYVAFTMRNIHSTAWICKV